MRNLFPLLILSLIFFAGCDDDDGPTIENEPETITDLVITFQPTGGTAGASVVMTFSDPDGPAGADGTARVNGTLTANTTYRGIVSVQNNMDPNVPINVSAEILNEADEHQYFYQVGGGLNLNVSYSDQDQDGNPLGQDITAQTGTASTGSLTVILRHEPNKDADGVRDGRIANAGGETDIQVTFNNITIQ